MYIYDCKPVLMIEFKYLDLYTYNYFNFRLLATDIGVERVGISKGQEKKIQVIETRLHIILLYHRLGSTTVRFRRIV